MIKSILLADDHTVVRKGLRTILEKEFPGSTISEVDNGIHAVEKAKDLSPGLIILDIGMPGLNGLEAISPILKKNPQARILILSIHKNKDFVIQALHSGAAGYLLKECAVDELVGAIKAIFRGKRYLSPGLARLVSDKDLFGKDAKIADKMDLLSLREREILGLLSEGLNNTQIAQRLFLSPDTVKTHRKNIMAKLDIHSMLGLVKFVQEHRLPSPF